MQSHQHKSKLTFSNGLLAFLVVINVLPFLAPLFLHLGLELPAKIIYFIYSFMCHQIHWRSLHVYDHQCAWCARDMAIWGAILFIAILYKFVRMRGLKFYELIPFIIPIALDGGIQSIVSVIIGGNSPPLYTSTNLMRALTGGFFGLGIGQFLIPMAASLSSDSYEEEEVRTEKDNKKPFWNSLKATLFGMTFITTIFIIIVQIWRLTSPSYPPSNWLDSEVKYPGGGNLQVIRRENGACPTDLSKSAETGSSPLELTCFFR